MSLNGLLLVDKETGITSQGVVAKARRSAGQKRIGHSGTLDPGATGLLLLAFGSATRLIPFTSGFSKSYSGELVLGTTTSSLDADGEVTGRYEMSGVGLQDVERAAEAFIGDIMQVPPMVSAVKHGGKRLHQLAREGVEVERKARLATVHGLEVQPTDQPLVFRLAAVVSTGTYIRSLAADIGEALGGGAHLRNLRRTAIGPFDVVSATAQNALDLPSEEWQGSMLSPLQMVSHLDAVTVDDQTVSRVANGARFEPGNLGESSTVDPFAVATKDGTLLAIYERRGDLLCSRVTLPTT